MIRYNELAKVSAVETFRNGIGGFKVDERVVSFRSPTKCPALEIVNSSAPHIAATEGRGVLIRNQDLPRVRVK